MLILNGYLQQRIRSPLQQAALLRNGCCRRARTLTIFCGDFYHDFDSRSRSVSNFFNRAFSRQPHVGRT
jgi:hypothetical protein